MRFVPAVLVLVASLPAPALQAFPLGVGYEITSNHVDVTDNSEDDAHVSYDFKQTQHTISLLDYTGLVCAGFQNAHRQMEARDQAMERAQYDSSIKPGDSVSYSYQPAEVMAGTPCGVKLHYVRTPGEIDVGGVEAEAKLTGWTAFGGLSKAWDANPDLFWRLMIMVDVRELRVEGAEKKGALMAMPFEYEVGRVYNTKLGGFIASGMVGYDTVFWIMKSLTAENFPTSFLRYGATVGYQLPIPMLQLRLSYKKTDEGFDSRGYKETQTTLGLFYQM